jgi:hypothetical protein
VTRLDDRADDERHKRDRVEDAVNPCSQGFGSEVLIERLQREQFTFVVTRGQK